MKFYNRTDEITPLATNKRAGLQRPFQVYGTYRTETRRQNFPYSESS